MTSVFDQFVTDCLFKTPKMKLTIRDQHGNQIGETCETPPGLRLEKFAMSQFSDDKYYRFEVSFPDGHKEFHVKVFDENDLIREYIGIYL